MAKSVRRDLRRAVGVSVVETVQNLDEAVGGLGLSVNKLRRDVVDLAVDHATFKQSAEQRMGLAHASLAEFCGRPFLGRLRWLFTGK